MKTSKKEDVVYNDTVLAVKSVTIGTMYLHRVRVWDKDTGALLMAMRMWSDKPYARGTFIKMQPNIPWNVAQVLRETKKLEAQEEVVGPTEPSEEEVQDYAKQLLEGQKLFIGHPEEEGS